jgi:acyl-CoA reductase-like NAD-dependent aldehyde dehydrogenase
MSEPSDLRLLTEHMDEVRFAAECCIFREGSAGNGCYFIEEGEVRLELDRLDTDSVLGFLGPNSFLGEVSLLDDQPRSASAYAHTDVRARWISSDDLHRLCVDEPTIGLPILRALGRDAASRLRHANERLHAFIASDAADPRVDEVVARAVSAQRSFEGWSESRVDALLEAIAQALADRAEQLAEQTVKETDIGNVADKVAKNRFAALEVCRSLVGNVGTGSLRVDGDRRVEELASPVGVILAIIPMTNPVATIAHNTLIALKARNAVILSCHRAARGVGAATAELIQGVLGARGAPVDLVQAIGSRGSRQKTALFMKHRGIAMILATGGPSMVTAAYSSGKPAIGVGAGNAPAWICADADIETAARLVVESKSFDYGIICGSEQHLVVDASVRARFVAALERAGGAVLTDEETQRLLAVAFDHHGALVRRWLGQSARSIADAADIRAGVPIRVLVFSAASDRLEGAACRERLAPVLSLFTVSGDDEAISLCNRLLAIEGAGHTAAIHSTSDERVARFGRAIPASRILVNSSAAQGCVGLGNGLVPSLTLGCGTFGGNSTTDNVGYKNLMNVKRIAHRLA